MTALYIVATVGGTCCLFLLVFLVVWIVVARRKYAYELESVESDTSLPSSNGVYSTCSSNYRDGDDDASMDDPLVDSSLEISRFLTHREESEVIVFSNESAGMMDDEISRIDIRFEDSDIPI